MNSPVAIKITAIGGPTALVEVDGFRFITDPTFDEAGGDYGPGTVTLHKNQGPAISLDQLPPIDWVLLSHDQHADNLDHSGRELVNRVGRVVTTAVGAQRLGLGIGLKPWEKTEIQAKPGLTFQITATPARHGPAGIEPLTGDVVGFVVTHLETGRDLFYVTGDTCWYSGVEEVSRRFNPEVVLLFGGAAQTRGPFHLTMDGNDAIETAVHFPGAKIVPLHHDSWDHFKQSGEDLVKAYSAVGLGHRLQMLEPGLPQEISLL